jgi:hypothetical protein
MLAVRYWTIEDMNSEGEQTGEAMSDTRPGEQVRQVRITEDVLSVDLLDGRTIIVPLAWYPRLLHGTPEQRANWQIAGGATASTGRIWLKI